MRRLIVIGLDSAPPSILFDRDKLSYLPNLSDLLEGSAKHRLVSCHPPITIPAWAVMVTGKTPGELGIYGFRHRKRASYHEFYIASSHSVRAPTIWDQVGARGCRSIVIGVPPSYPPKPMKGWLVSGLVTPSSTSNYTWPPKLREEVRALVGDYVFDVEFRTEDRGRVVKEVWHMTQQHFNVFRHLLRSRRWNFAMIVEIGLDRIQHAFWGYMDSSHRKYEANNPYEEVIMKYYRLLDHEIGEVLKIVPKDTAVVVASDHGAKAMKGAFCVNQWLVEEGYLRLEEEPSKPGVELSKLKVDWDRTIAWGWGGYYARIFINLRGREPRGSVKPEDYEAIRDQLIKDLESIKGPQGERWRTRAYRPEDLYPECMGDKPDLMVYFDDLSWRSAGTLGWASNYLPENDVGPDDAVHDWIGVFTVHDPEGTVNTRGLSEVRIEECIELFKSLLGLES